MREVILNGLPDNYSKERHVLFSIANFQGNEDKYDEFGDDIVVQNLLTNEDRIRISKLTCDFAASQIPYFRDYFNQHYSKSFSAQFWKIIIYPWLAIITQILYDRQFMVSELIQKIGKEQLTFKLLKSEDLPKITDLMMLIKESFLPHLNHWILSRIIEHNRQEDWHLYYIERQSEKTVTINKSAPPSLIRSIIELVIKLLTRRCNKIYGMNTIDRIFFSSLMSIKSPVRDQGREENYDKVMKVDIKWLFDYDSVIKELIPKSLMELKLDKKVRNNIGRIRLYSNELYYDLHSKTKAAFQKVNGELIIPAQHGGYSILTGYINELNYNTELKQNYFISWGLKDTKIDTIIPLPSPLLSKMLNKHKETDCSIILMSTAARFYNIKFQSGLPPNSIFEYRKGTEGFIQGLDPLIYENLVYRPYFDTGSNLKDESYFINRFKNLSVLKGQNIHPALLGCRLLVLDHPGTTLALAIAANIPFILVFNPKIFPVIGDVKKYYDEFRRLSIYYTDISFASRFVNQNFENIHEWWSNPEIQKLRIAFMEEYAQAKRNWRRTWSQTLWNLK